MTSAIILRNAVLDREDRNPSHSPDNRPEFMEKRFAFVNDAAESEYKDLPKDITGEFGASLRAVQEGKKPFLETTYLRSIGQGVIELKINGSPAFRCIYIAKFMNTVVVLHSFKKTTNGVDKKAIRTGTMRYKELMAEIKNSR